MDATIRVVVCAAIRHRENGKVLCGVHHGSCLNLANCLGLGCSSEVWECGFVDNKSVFLTRQEAWKVADEAGQIRRPTGWEKDYSEARPAGIGDEGMLFSENLYRW